MNIHHLELFYYVARHGGITQAVRNIPYGIQQPAISGQVAQLEEFLGVSLFQRRPFALTPAGERLYEFIKPFFSSLDAMAAELQGGGARQIRIGASTFVLRDHLPALFQRVRRRFADLKVSLREGYQGELESRLERDELDLVVTVLQKKPAPGLHSLELIKVPLVLLVPKESPITSADQLWKRDRIDEPLICLPAIEPVCKHFQQGLAQAGLEWFPSIEVSSLELIETYVASGFGIGLYVQAPKAPLAATLRKVPLEGFPPVVVGALWRGKPGPILKGLLDEMQAHARSLA